eukprot:TRINITY_DN791_c0_g1_i1.p1 TRINITY_DN791_c0_g1~~TRINITY_DN791_c0_g1_i1.p1  ORF type:complete len:272 (-),score=46.12 TRINITY_DN791_c0_g1_i1:66-881(-)
MRVAKKERSEVLAANAWHHRSDALSSVIALVGVVGSMMGLPLLDPLAGVLVAMMILRAAHEIFFSSVHELTDHQKVEASLLKQISDLLKDIPDIHGVHNLRGRRLGHYTLVDFHISVHPTITVSAGHQIAERARVVILETFPHVREALIHVEAAELTALKDGRIQVEGVADEHALLRPHAEVLADVQRLVQTVAAVKETDLFQVHYWGENINVSFAIVIDSATSMPAARKLAKEVESLLLRELTYLGTVKIKLDLTSQAPSEVEKRDDSIP